MLFYSLLCLLSVLLSLKTGVAVDVGDVVNKFAKNETILIIAIMMLTGIMSGLLSNTGTAAVMIPVVIGILVKRVVSTKLNSLMPIAFATAMGGIIFSCDWFPLVI